MNAVASRTSPLSLGHREALSPRSGEDEALLLRGEDAPRFEPVLQESLDGGAHARDALGRLAGDDERLAADASQHGDGLALAGLLHLVALGVESHSSADLNSCFEVQKRRKSLRRLRSREEKLFKFNKHESTVSSSYVLAQGNSWQCPQAVKPSFIYPAEAATSPSTKHARRFSVLIHLLRFIKLKLNPNKMKI